MGPYGALQVHSWKDSHGFQTMGGEIVCGKGNWMEDGRVGERWQTGLHLHSFTHSFNKY